jgi:hypothetical protein
MNENLFIDDFAQAGAFSLEAVAQLAALRFKSYDPFQLRHLSPIHCMIIIISVLTLRLHVHCCKRV